MDPTFQYAGATRIPPKEFQLRARIEHNTKDMVNLKLYKHIETDTPDLTHNFPQLVYSKGRTYDSITNRPVGYSQISDSENAKMSEFLYGTSTISYKDPSSDRLPSYARSRIEPSVDIVTGYKQPNYKITNIPYYDMAPQNTRYDARDYKQAQPFVAGGPDLALNPYFDRYDPVSDPRNAVRELRSAVYEDKGGDKGYEESQKKLRRNFENRWIPEELITDDLMDSFLRNETVLPSIKGESKYSVKNIEKGLFNPNTFESCDILDPIAKLVPKKPTVTMKDQIDQLLKQQKSRDEEDKKNMNNYFKNEVKKEVIAKKAISTDKPVSTRTLTREEILEIKDKENKLQKEFLPHTPYVDYSYITEPPVNLESSTEPKPLYPSLNPIPLISRPPQPAPPPPAAAPGPAPPPPAAAPPPPPPPPPVVEPPPPPPQPPVVQPPPPPPVVVAPPPVTLSIQTVTLITATFVNLISANGTIPRLVSPVPVLQKIRGDRILSSRPPPIAV